MSLYIPITFSQIEPLIKQGVTELAILNVLRRVAIKYTPIIQKTTPVDTGRLKRSMRVELTLDNRGLAITSEVFYAGFVEFGTKKMKPRLFAQAYVEPIVREVIAGLEELSGQKLEVKPIRKIRNDESGLYSGLTTQSLSGNAFNQVINNLVSPSSVGKLSVTDLRVEDQRVKELAVENDAVMVG